MALFAVALSGLTACSLLDSGPTDSDDDDEDEGVGGNAPRGGRQNRGGVGGTSGTGAGVSGSAPQGGDSGTSAGGSFGGTQPLGGTPAMGGSFPSGGSLPTGGTPSGGASGASSGGTGGLTGPIECGASWAVNEGGYVTAPGSSGCWRGYAYLGTAVVGSMISPTTFAACGNPCMLCGAGIVAPDILYGGVAFVGFNLSQMADSDVSSAVTPTGNALTVSFSNPGGSALRVQLGGPNGATSALERWCYTLTGFERDRHHPVLELQHDVLGRARSGLQPRTACERAAPRTRRQCFIGLVQRLSDGPLGRRSPVAEPGRHGSRTVTAAGAGLKHALHVNVSSQMPSSSRLNPENAWPSTGFRACSREALWLPAMLSSQLAVAI